MKVLFKLIFSLLIIQLPCVASEPQVKAYSEGEINTYFDCACKCYNAEQYEQAIPKFMFVVENIRDLADHANLKNTSRFLLGVIYVNLKDPLNAYKFLLPVTLQDFDIQLKIDAHHAICQAYKGDTSNSGKAIFDYHSKVVEFTESKFKKMREVNQKRLEQADGLITESKYSDAKKLLFIVRKNNFDLASQASANLFLGMIDVINKDYASALLYLREAAQQDACFDSRKESCKLLAHMIINGHSKDFSLVRKLILKFMKSLSRAEKSQEYELFKKLREFLNQILEIENKLRSANKTF